MLACIGAPALARTGGGRAVHAPTLDACSWDRPGVDPFMGDVVAAVDRYQDISPDVRQRIKARMAKREYDDIVSIRRDSITSRGKARYGSTIRDMHFGKDRLCHSVSRAAWSPQMQERGLVYCDGGTCILVPTVCRNVSRIARAEVAPAHAEDDTPALPAVATVAPLPPIALAPDSPQMPPPDATEQSGEGVPLSFAAGSEGAVGLPAPGGGQPIGGGTGSVPPVNVPISPVPEPETWALLIAGLAALAAMARSAPRPATQRAN